MINNLMRRPMLVAGVAVLGLVSGCAGGGGAAPGDRPAAETSSSKPPISDPAVTAAALRAVDPCALLNPENLGSIGSIVEDSYSESEWGHCRATLHDPSGKELDMTLRMGVGMTSTDEAIEALEGLPLEVDKSDEDSCFVTAVTSHEALQGIKFQVDYAGGDACAAGRTGLQRVIQNLRNNPPKYRSVPLSAQEVDPCASADPQVLAEVLGKNVPGEAQDLHQCDFWQSYGTYPLVGVSFRKSLPAKPEEGTPVDLGGGITAIQQPRDSDDVSCEVSWLHVETPTEDEAGGFGEVMAVQYTNDATGGVDMAGACERAVKVAKTIIPKLPTA